MDTRTSAVRETIANEEQLARGDFIHRYCCDTVIIFGMRVVPGNSLRGAHVKRLIISSDVVCIGADALRDSTIEEVLIRKITETKNGVTYADQYNIKYDNLKRLSSNAFRNCKQLKVFESHMLNHVGFCAFQGCKNLKENALHIAQSAYVDQFAFGF